MRRAAQILAVGLLALATGCKSAPPRLPTPQLIPEPDPSEVERVLFLVGDAGDALSDRSPILPRLRQDVETWAARLEADSAVTVLYLGDIVYPYGLHPPGHDLYPRDSAVVMDQVALVGGPAALERGAQGYFMAGNHDWGLKEDWEGFVRLKTLDDFLDRAREATGASVRLVPEAGTGGPYVLDLGGHIRLLVLDTAWWLLRREDVRAAQAAVLEGIEEAMRSAGERQVLIAAHHPFLSAGPHGGQFDFWETLGVRYLLVRSGAVLQDLTSLPYRELEFGLREIFARNGVPLAFIGGHEHSLQIIAGTRPDSPLVNIVSGAASKLTGVSGDPAMTFGRPAPGYMRLLVEHDGGVTLFVESAPEEFLSCPEEDPERAECMAAGVAAYRTVHSQRLR